MLHGAIGLRSHALATAATLLCTFSVACDDASPAAAVNDAAPLAEGAALDASAARDAGRDGGATDAAGDAGGRADAGGQVEIGDDYMRWPALIVPGTGLIALTFELPSDARSFVLTFDPGASPRLIELYDIAGPGSDEPYNDLDDPRPPEKGLYPVTAANVSDALPYSLMLPSSPDAPLRSGRYQVRVAIQRAGVGRGAPLAADLVWQRAPQSEPGRFSLVLWFAPGAALDARTAEHDETLQAALARVREIYAAAGVELSDIAYRDLDGDGTDALAMIDDDAEFAELFARIAEQSAGDRALDIAFVAQLEVTGKTVTGKTAGVPVPPSHPALSRRTGIVVPLDTLPSEPERIAELLGHEIGHALGLGHTTEYDGVRHDPIEDTPACPSTQATAITSAGEKVLTAEDCADFDGSNLLFYTEPTRDTSQRELTPGQAYVLQRSPLVR